MKEKTRKILLILFSIVFIGSLYYKINYQYTLKLEEKRIEELKQKSLENPKELDIVEKQPKDNNKNEIIVDDEEKVENTKQVLPQYSELYQENSDLIGWITIEDTPIDYPVMQTIDDPIYYIHRDWDKNDSTTGLPLIDARCTIESENIIIYSHNMKDGTMFGTLKKYKDKSYYDSHSIIKFNTIYEEAQYQIISISLAKVYYDDNQPEDEFLYYNYIDLDSKQEFQLYIDNIKKNSLYDTGISAEYGDKLITLCTCDYYTEDGRLLVVAKKIQ